MSEEAPPKWELPHDAEFESSVLRALGWMVVQSNMLEDALVDVYRSRRGRTAKTFRKPSAVRR